MVLPFHQHLFPPVKKIMREYDMLRDGDRVAVGVSGGKDSLATLYTLAQLRRILPTQFTLTAITIDMGWPGSDWSGLREFCRTLEVPLKIVSTQIGPILFDIRKENNPCSLCSKMRHGALNSSAKGMDCNVVALGHHREDAIETVFMNMFYNGRISCFHPVTRMERSQLLLIRPMLYISEKTTALVAEKLNLPVGHNPCPANGNSKRQHIKEMLAIQTRHDKVIPKRLITAVRTLWDNPSL